MSKLTRDKTTAILHGNEKLSAYLAALEARVAALEAATSGGAIVLPESPEE